MHWQIPHIPVTTPHLQKYSGIFLSITPPSYTDCNCNCNTNPPPLIFATVKWILTRLMLSTHVGLAVKATIVSRNVGFPMKTPRSNLPTAILKDFPRVPQWETKSDHNCCWLSQRNFQVGQFAYVTIGLFGRLFIQLAFIGVLRAVLGIQVSARWSTVQKLVSTSPWSHSSHISWYNIQGVGGLEAWGE